MDYFKIGQLIRKFRKAQGLSQEELAERVGISTTHMSHIETGNTKLSLSVLVEIAKTLEVPTDRILFESPIKKDAMVNELQTLIDSCSAQELSIIIDTAKSLKAALNKHA